MRGRGKTGWATKCYLGAATIISHMVAYVWVLPACWVAWEAPNGNSLEWRIAALGGVVAAAICLDVVVKSMRYRYYGNALLCLVVGGILTLVNVGNAIDNAAATSDHNRDGRKTAMVAGETASSQRQIWSQGRIEQVKVAGETAAATIQAEINAAIASDAGRWNATNECNASDISAKATKVFCSNIANLKSKLAAAQKRDELDAKIAKLDEKTEGQKVVTSLDPGADTVAELLSIANVTMSADQKALYPRVRSLMNTVALEVIAGFMPGITVFFLSLMFAAAKPETPETAAPAAKAPKKAATPADVPAKAVSEPVQPVSVPLDDIVHRFIAERLERHEGSILKAGEVWDAWMEWAQKNSADIGNQRQLGMKIGKIFTHERNNNRPRYLNVRIKAANVPSIRLAVSNTA